MRGSQEIKQRITPAEAMQLFEFARTEEMYIAGELYQEYRTANEMRESPVWDILDTWDTLALLAFVYDTGRVQGIREERAKRA